MVSPEEAKTLAMLAHVLNFVLLGPLIIYLAKKGQNAFLDGEAREALNFSITCAIGHLILFFAGFSHLMFCLFSILRAALWITQLVLGVIGGMSAREGIAYQYPVNLRLIK
jgi:hypothetical protein